MMAALHILNHALLDMISFRFSWTTCSKHKTGISSTIKTKKKITHTNFLFDDLYVKLSPLSLKGYTRKRQTRYLSIQIQYNVHKRLHNVHKRLTEARFRFVTMTSTNCIKYKTVVVVKNITHLSVQFNNT